MIPRRRRQMSAAKKKKVRRRSNLKTKEYNPARETRIARDPRGRKKKNLVSIVPLYLDIVTIKTIIMLHTQMIRYEYKE